MSQPTKLFTAEAYSKTGSLIWKIQFDTLKSARDLWEVIRGGVENKEWKTLRIEFTRSDDDE